MRRLETPPLVRALCLPAVLFAIYLWRWQFVDVPLERDEGEYAYFGQVLRDGGTPYVDAHNMKFPGVYLVYGAVFSLCDDNARAVRLTATAAHLLSAVFLYLLARRWFNFLPSLLAVASFGFLASGIGILGFAAKAEHFVLAFALPALWLAVRAEGALRLVHLAAAGALLGCAVLMKQSAFLLALPVVAACRAQGWRRSAERGLAFALGLAVPLTAMGAMLVASRAWDSFWFWTVVYAREYGTQIGFADGLVQLGRAAHRLLQDGPWVWLAAGLGGVAAAFRYRARAFQGFWWIVGASLASPALGWRFSEHYFLPALPAAALLTAALSDATRSRVRSLGAALVAAGVLVSAVQMRLLLRELRPEQVARLVYQANPFPEAMEVGRFLASRTAPEDQLAVLGSEPQIYFYARRRAATSYLYMYPLMEAHPYAERMQEELIAQLEARKPRYAVLVNVASSWRMQPHSPRRIFEWSQDWVNREYEQVGLIEISPDGPSWIFWDDAAKRFPSGDTYLAVFRRRP